MPNHRSRLSCICMDACFGPAATSPRHPQDTGAHCRSTASRGKSETSKAHSRVRPRRTRAPRFCYHTSATVRGDGRSFCFRSSRAAHTRSRARLWPDNRAAAQWSGLRNRDVVAHTNSRCSCGADPPLSNETHMCVCAARIRRAGPTRRFLLRLTGRRLPCHLHPPAGDAETGWFTRWRAPLSIATATQNGFQHSVTGHGVSVLPTDEVVELAQRRRPSTPAQIVTHRSSKKAPT